MYQINRLQKKVLITPKEVMFHSPAGHTIDERQYLQNIIVAESRFIIPAIGFDFYSALVNSKNVVVTSGNQNSLLASVNAYSTGIGGPAFALTDLPIGTVVNASELMSANNQNLWNEHLWKLVAECVEYCLIVPTFVQHTSQGQQKMNPDSIGGNGQGSVTADLKEIKYKDDKFMQDRIDPLLASLRFFLCKNSALYPLSTMDCGSGQDTADGISLSRKSPIIHGIYDDDDTNTCPE